MTAIAVAEARRALTHVIDHEPCRASALRRRGDTQERAVVDFIKIGASEDAGAILEEVGGRWARDGHNVSGDVAVPGTARKKGDEGTIRAHNAQTGIPFSVPL